MISRQKELADISDQDIEELLTLIRTYLSMKYGREYMIQIEKLIRTRQYDRTIMLLNATPKRRISFKLKNKLSKSFFLILMLGAGISFVVFGYNDVANSKQSKNWPSIKGKIIKSRVGRETLLNESTLRDFADIEYEYKIGTKYFKSTKVSFADSENPVSIVKRYQVGSSVDVYYKVDNPEISVLEPGFSRMTYMWFGGAAIIFFMAFLFFKIGKVKI